MLAHGGLSPELRRQVGEDSLRGGDQVRLAWPCQGLVQDVSAGVSAIVELGVGARGSHVRVAPQPCSPITCCR
ncbi:hypothetical protein ACQ4WX_05415 [Streptomyces lasalocidi]